MFFEKELLSFNILDVLKLKQQNVERFNSGRNFHALSFRFRSDAVLKNKTSEYRLQDNSLCYFPARLDYSRVASVDEIIVIHFELFNYNSQDIEYFVPKEPKRFSQLFQKILDLWQRHEIGYKYQCSAVLYEIFSECYAQNYKPEEQSSKISASVDYLNKNYKKSNLTIKEIADKSFMSEVYFRKLFRAEFGISPQKYIINLRIRNAASLISTGYYSLQDIASLCGYTDYKYFSVEFKRIIGISPSDYLYNYGD